MARSLAIAAYLAGLGSPDRSDKSTEQPPRPNGAIIWARCSHPDQLTAVENLDRKLSEDGDPVRVIATLLDWNPIFADRALPEPRGRTDTRKFIAHWQPVISVWIKGDLAPLLLAEIRNAGIATIFVDASAEGLEDVTGTWVPGAMKSLLSQFEAVFAVDQTAADRLVQAGTRAETVVVTGAMEDCAPTLPCNEADRSEIAAAIGTRPVWLAAGASLEECGDIARAHQLASRRAHRLLLIFVPKRPDMADHVTSELRKYGFNVAERSSEPAPSEITQVYVVDTEEDMGLWYRIAPITYLGGTLDGGGCRDPFEAAALGTAVLYGPQVAPYQRHAARLNAAGASRLIRSPSELGPNVESLLSADKTAQLAHAAWDVTSRGAGVTNRIAAFIQLRLEELVP
ncbi:3-deoxy-D-manno-octulosonic-acid transferase [Yoonia maricola]|uniref:3-deoxy-D-manno-octulosonic acid transferase n=1 Tax=Yoonia maricola TaxID=420999 RepID=A0A2M8W0X1_9RHOB|nr:glycosyltransferase N-terminal domain-containing protein [Yoonia maricola]PJI84567.1 3-deoxy-D-manno-octulosonic-acid transferase [Yoonia maricola]